MITTITSRPSASIEALRAIVEPRKMTRADDLPVVTVEGIDFRLDSVAGLAASTGFAAMLSRVGISREPVWVAHMVMMAALKAMRDHRARTEWRQPALADVQAQLAMLDRANAALVEYSDAHEVRGRRASAVAQTLTPHPTSRPLPARDLLRQIEQDRQRLLDEAAALDGRCRPTSRARLFVDALVPLFAELTAGRYGQRTGLTDFVRHSCLLVTGKMPSETLLRSAVTKRTK